MKQFFQTVKDSIYNPGFYRDLPERGLFSSVKYFAKFVLFIACIVSIIPIAGGVSLLTWKGDEIDGVRRQVIDTFPNELVLKVKNGEVSTNVSEPYAIAIPDIVKGDFSDRRAAYDPKNLLVINTKKSIETKDFQEYRTVAILGKSEIGFFDSRNGRVEIQSLGKVSSDYALDRNNFEFLIDKAWSVIKTVGIIVLIFLPLIIFFGVFIGYSIYLLFGALVVWLAANIAKKSLTYKQSYAAGLHLITLPLILAFLLPFIFHIPLMFSLALFLVAYMNFNQTEAMKQSPEEKLGDDQPKSSFIVPASRDIKDAEIEEKKSPAEW